MGTQGENWWSEKDPSGRATCKLCGKLIKKGCLRLAYLVTERFGHPEYCYYHARCGYTFMTKEVERLDKIIREVDKYLKEGGK